MLEIKNLYVEGKGHAQLLRGVSFSMKLGECIGLTGPSGAGKTTIIKAIMGVLDHTCRIPSGDILLDGVSLPAMPPAKRRDLCGTTLGFIPQNPMTAFDPHIRMGKLMEETFCLRLNCSKAEARKLAADTLRRVNLLGCGPCAVLLSHAALRRNAPKGHNGDSLGDAAQIHIG